MAKTETVVQGSFDGILNRIEQGIMRGSASASLEEKSDFVSGNCRCSVRVFERYSMTGSNRVSLNVTLFMGSDGRIRRQPVICGPQSRRLPGSRKTVHHSVPLLRRSSCDVSTGWDMAPQQYRSAENLFCMEVRKSPSRMIRGDLLLFGPAGRIRLRTDAVNKRRSAFF